jgi:hypothetical protein
MFHDKIAADCPLVECKQIGPVFVHPNIYFSLVADIEIKRWWMQLLLYFSSHCLLLPLSFRSNVKVSVFFLFLRTYHK